MAVCEDCPIAPYVEKLRGLKPDETGECPGRALKELVSDCGFSVGWVCMDPAVQLTLEDIEG